MTLEELRTFKPQIQALARQYRIDPDSIRVFGSVARGDSRPDSDVDFLVRTLPDCGLFRIGGFYGGLQSLLAREVDIVTEDAVSPYLSDSIFSSARPL